MRSRCRVSRTPPTCSARTWSNSTSVEPCADTGARAASSAARRRRAEMENGGLSPRSPSPLPGRPVSQTNLADILERVLDKGIVIAGDIQINLLDIELLTIKLRLLVASVERAQEMGINWWESDPTLSGKAQELEEENEDLRARLERLEKAAGLPAPRPGEEVVLETRHREVVEEEDGDRTKEEFTHEEHEDVRD